MTTLSFNPQRNSLGALLDLIYRVKFSRHVPLTIILLSAIYAVYRSQHYLTTALKTPPVVSIPTAVFVELLVLGSGALVFIAYRERYITELRQADTHLSRIGSILATVALVIALLGLLILAFADAWLTTNGNLAAAVVMVLVQYTQGSFIISFVISSLLETREDLRLEYRDYEQDQLSAQLDQVRKEAEFKATHCPYCKEYTGKKNRSRHMRTCASKPEDSAL